MSKEELIEYIKNINESNNGKYGLIWDKEKEPEKIVEECSKYIPVLKEDESRRIERGEENNILIEGDNFHSLSVLNYTHREAIDIIYIDPPYNKGKRKFILCTNNEVSNKLQIEYMKKNNITEKELNRIKENPDEKWRKYSEENGICTSVTYPRMKNVIEGYKGKNGLEGTLRYYKTEFVENNVTRDQIYYDLTEKCIPMLCIKEDTYKEIEKTEEYTIYSNNEKNKYTCVYFDTISNRYDEFIEKVKKINEEKILYIFTLGNEIDEPRLKEIKNYKIEAIPQRIYDLYRKLAKMSKEM